jgi:hypothetical protein
MRTILSVVDPLPEIIDPVFAKTSPKRSFLMTEYERFGLVFTKTRVYKFGRDILVQILRGSVPLIYRSGSWSF